MKAHIGAGTVSGRKRFVRSQRAHFIVGQIIESERFHAGRNVVYRWFGRFSTGRIRLSSIVFDHRLQRQFGWFVGRLRVRG